MTEKHNISKVQNKIQNDAQLTPLSPGELNRHHFGEADWDINFGNYHHLFHINRLEDVINKLRFPIAPHRKTVYDFFFLSEGKSIRSKGLHKYEFGENHFFFLPAYQISTHELVSLDSKGFFCHFSIDVFSKLFGHSKFLDEFDFWQSLGNPLVKIDTFQKDLVVHILERLLKEYESNHSLNLNLIASYLFTLFTELNIYSQKAESNTKNAAQKITEKYKNLLSQYIYKTNKVSDYAEMLSISTDHLNKCVKATLGKTSQEILAEMVILEAKVMLRQTNLSISAIAFKFSETNPSDFTRFFRIKTGYSPKEFRKIDL